MYSFKWTKIVVPIRQHLYIVCLFISFMYLIHSVCSRSFTFSLIITPIYSTFNVQPAHPLVMT